jgi:ERF superfamily protein
METMSQEIVAGQPGQNSVAISDEPQTMLSTIIALAKDPSVDVEKLQALLAMQERMEVRQAEVEFNQALARLAGQMPRIKKNGRVELGPGKGSYPFAKWEDIDRIIRPLMDAEGFTLSFTSQPRTAEGGGLIVTGILKHRQGHSLSASMPLPLDTGPGRNNLQAGGSTLSYGKRYCAEMLLNIVREGEDDDGAKGGAEPISDEECAELSRGLTETKSSIDGFLRYMGVAAIPDIQKRDLTAARNAINAKRKRGAA